MQFRFQFPLYKLFLVIAAYAIAFGMYFGCGPDWRPAAVIGGTSLSLLVILVRRSDVRSICVVGAMTLAGGVLGAMCSPMIGRSYDDAQYYLNWHVFYGLIAGGLVGMVATGIGRRFGG